MPSRFDPPSDPKPPESGEALIDINKRYDVYCCERDHRIVVYRNALFRGVRALYRRNQFDTFSEYIELEQSNGQTIFIQRHGIVSFCEPGTELTAEMVTRK